MFSDPPEFGEIRTGWYQENNEWWLTFGALRKEFHNSGRKIGEVTATTHRGQPNEGKLRTTTLFNKYSGRSFVVYSLDDTLCLMRHVSTGK